MKQSKNDYVHSFPLTSHMESLVADGEANSHATVSRDMSTSEALVTPDGDRRRWRRRLVLRVTLDTEKIERLAYRLPVVLDERLHSRMGQMDPVLCQKLVDVRREVAVIVDDVDEVVAEMASHKSVEPSPRSFVEAVVMLQARQLKKGRG